MILDLGEARPRTEVIATTWKRPLWSQENLSDWWACYAEKLEGANESTEETEGTIHACFSFLGCFISISLLGLLQEFLVPGLSNVYQVPLVLLTPSWGVTAIQVFCAWPVPGAQPKNVILGNLIGALSALVVQVTPFPDLIPKTLQAAVAVSSTLLLQEMAGAVHPAGAATAFLLGNAEEITWHSLGLTIFASVLIVAVAVLFNNLSIDRFYPQYWWPVRPPDGPPGQLLQPPVSFIMEAPEQWLKVYLEKIQGGDASGPLQVSIAHSCFSALASLVFMLSLILINEAFGFDPSRLAAAAAASSLLFSDWQGAHSQPLPCLIGSLIAGLCGSLCQVLPQLGMEIPMWTQAALGVGLTAFSMDMVNSAFPAGGAIALGFVVNPPRIPWVSVLYTGLLSSALIIYGVFVNNLQETRLYPRRWPWQKGTSPRYPPPASLPAHRYSERNLIRRWTDETNSGTSGTKYSKIYVGVLTVGLQFFFLTFLFFADFDVTDSVASMCNDWAWVSFALVGLVYTRSFLKAYGLGSVGYCLLILCVSVQWSMIVESLVNGTVLHVSFANLMNGCSSAAAVLVSFGALVGKVDPLQILTLVLIELPCYCWNKVVFLQMGSEKTPLVQDRGTLLIFLFGSFFGLAAGKTLGVPEMDWLNRSQRNTELLSLFGTCCLWCSLPSFPRGDSETSSSTMAWQHTVLALLGSTVATFTLDPFLHDGRLEPAAVRSAVLAGGVAISGVADIVGPCTALAVGCIAGSASTICLGFSDKNVDTSGVFYVYGLPALIGGITSMGRINHESLGNQAFGLCGTLTIACLSGAVCGRLLRSLRGSVELAFSDEVHWDCAEDLPRGVLSL